MSQISFFLQPVIFVCVGVAVEVRCAIKLDANALVVVVYV